jgi:hypothetical protein
MGEMFQRLEEFSVSRGKDAFCDFEKYIAHRETASVV